MIGSHLDQLFVENRLSWKVKAGKMVKTNNKKTKQQKKNQKKTTTVVIQVKNGSSLDQGGNREDGKKWYLWCKP